MMIRILAALLLLAPATAWACASGHKLVFACPTANGKHIEVCQGPAAIHYSFGKRGQKPELTLSARNEDFVWEHGEGVGSGIGDDLVFRNGKTQYTISHVSNFDDPTDTVANLWISEPGKENVSIDCAAGKAKFNPTAIEAKQREMSEGIPSL